MDHIEPINPDEELPITDLEELENISILDLTIYFVDLTRLVIEDWNSIQLHKGSSGVYVKAFERSSHYIKWLGFDDPVYTSSELNEENRLFSSLESARTYLAKKSGKTATILGRNPIRCVIS